VAGALLVCGEHRRELHGGSRTPRTTAWNTAAIEALAALKRGCRVSFTDSQYVRNGITGGCRSGKARLEDSGQAREKRRSVDAPGGGDPASPVKWHWVKGTQAIPATNGADELANPGIVADG
jgi:ribonuclease HI